MFHREIITAIEIGTAKFGVLIGEALPDGSVTILGRGSAPAAGSVVKGEIDNMDLAFDQLDLALREAENNSDHQLDNTKGVVVAVTGCGIDTISGVGSVFIKNEEHKVTAADRDEAGDNARILPLAPDREVINCCESCYMVDGRRLRNPLNHSGSKLEAYMNMIHGQSARLQNFRNLVTASGFEETPLSLLFSPLAAAQGVLSEEERENGVLLIDLGAGTSEYVVESGCCMRCCGVLPVGCEHIANDLALGLELPIADCRELLVSGTLNRAFANREEFICCGSGHRRRQIPLVGFETIIDCRLREIFDVLGQQISAKGGFRDLEAGGVLTGGGALLQRSGLLFNEVFGFSCRVGTPVEPGGAVSGLEDPRYSVLWGALKTAGIFNRMNQFENGGGAVGKVIDAMDSLLDRTRRGFRNLTGSIKG